MLELLSLLGGAVARLVPAGLELFKRAQDNKHELAMLAAQVELAKQQAEAKQQEIQLTADASVESTWASALLEAQKATVVQTGIRFVDGANALMRPLITFWWAIVLYTAAKTTLVASAWAGGASAAALAGLLITDFDKAIVGSVVSYWFVDRTLRKRSV